MRNYLQEEVFVDEFESWAWAASKAVGGEWRPNTNCTDADRRSNERFMNTGQMTWLVFTSASVHNAPGEDVHAQIILESSKRLVNVRVRSSGGKAVAEILIDRAK